LKYTTVTTFAGHLDSVLHNVKTDNDKQIINKQHAAAEINQPTNQHNKQKNSTNRSSLCIPVYIQLLIDRGWGDHVNNIKYSTNCSSYHFWSK